ncbi:MAG TPA: M20/M25/M40 family metallo-hydrolase [Gemmatimonadaceae bacterium]|nr:M20/M25/M40 family metallo-hydrolase [Gemmatimonadaceae bacterium]
MPIALTLTRTRSLLLALPLLLPAASAAQAIPRAPDAAAIRSAARSYRAANESAILHEFSDFLAIPNLASDAVNIRRNANYLVAMLERRGVRARLLEVAGSPPAVLGELTTPAAKRTLVLYAHYDGQPVDPSQWATPPWTPTLRSKSLAEGGFVIPMPGDGRPRVSGEARIYARSAGDDKASIQAMLSALDAMRAARLSPSVNLKFFFDGEEEAGSPHLRQMLERHRDALKGDAWLFCDGPNHQSGKQQVQLGVRGITGLEVTVYGPTRALHSGHYGNWAPNPGAMIASLIASMRDDNGRIRIAGFYDDVKSITPSERRAITAVPPVDATLRRSLGLAATEARNAPLAERIMLPAINVRGMRVGAVGDQAANVISTEAQASFDFRLVPNQTPERVRQLVNAHIIRQGYFVTSDSVTTAMRLSHPKIARVRWGSGGYPATRASTDQPFVRAVVRAVGDGAGTPPLLLPTMGGSLPLYVFEQVLRVPVIVLPIANFDNNQHAANENLRIQNLWDGIEVYAGLMGRIGEYWR